ncbi:MAG: hypothetical protein IJA34_01340, partial [Lachnospiraceae bacterium]|nr:hypothetical protein [Lachnospiraceae bacterium]
MKKIFTRALSLVVILSVLCCSLVFAASAVGSHTTQVLELSKTEHSSCTSPGSINFVDGWYKFENAGDHVLGTGPILGKKVSNFIWEFDYACDDPSWRQECFMFHANSDGIYESDTYTLRIEGNGMFGGIRLFKNADY